VLGSGWPLPRRVATGEVRCSDRGCTTINRTVIRCNCGHRVLRGDVIQTGLYMSVLGPNWVYVRFRCGRCKRVREQLIQEADWDPSVLLHCGAEVSEADLLRFERMGEITPDEIIEFHYALEQLGADHDAVA